MVSLGCIYIQQLQSPGLYINKALFCHIHYIFLCPVSRVGRNRQLTEVFVLGEISSLESSGSECLCLLLAWFLDRWILQYYWFVVNIPSFVGDQWSTNYAQNWLHEGPQWGDR
jgi:hypothetical protein